MAAPLVSYAIDIDQQVPRTAEHLAAPVRWRIDHQPRVLDAVQERLEGSVHLEPCQRAAETGVNSAAPAEMLVVPARGVELVGIIELSWVAVAGGVQQEDRRALRND